MKTLYLAALVPIVLILAAVSLLVVAVLASFALVAFCAFVLVDRIEELNKGSL